MSSRFCQNCGTPLTPSDVFCPVCGRAVDRASVSAPPGMPLSLATRGRRSRSVYFGAMVAGLIAGIVFTMVGKEVLLLVSQSAALAGLLGPGVGFGTSLASTTGILWNLPRTRMRK